MVSHSTLGCCSKKEKKKFPSKTKGKTKRISSHSKTKKLVQHRKKKSSSYFGLGQKVMTTIDTQHSCSYRGKNVYTQTKRLNCWRDFIVYAKCPNSGAREISSGPSYPRHHRRCIPILPGARSIPFRAPGDARDLRQGLGHELG